MENSKIAWTDHTFNPWIGRTEAGPGCVNCYARTQDRYYHWTKAGWGKGKPRHITSDAKWREPLKWERDAAREDVRKRVFCASLADVFDAEAPEGGRERLWKVIRHTPHLDWLLLTKRTQNIEEYLPDDWGTGYANVWLGVTCEDRKHGYARVDVLRNIPAAVRFISCEPLLEDVSDVNLDGIDWVIVGGESGPGARAFDVDWARSLRDACSAAGVRFFCKQLGSKPLVEGSPFNIPKTPEGKRDRDGKYIGNFPTDLQVQEMPLAALRSEPVAAPDGLPIESFKHIILWLDDYATNDASVLSHLALSAMASIAGMIAVLAEINQPDAA